jgi:vacuolar-type H+-ATPase subunit H
MTAQSPEFWAALSAMLGAAYGAGPERTQRVVAARHNDTRIIDRAAENVEIVAAAVLAHPGCNSRELRDRARAQAKARLDRGLSGAEHDEAVRVALSAGRIRREGTRSAGYRFEPCHAHDTPRQRAADEPAQEHNAGTQTTEATRDAENAGNSGTAAETREETPQEDTSAPREMSDTARGMSDIDGREGQRREEGQNDGSRGGGASERVAPESVPPPCGRAEHAGWEWHSVAGGVQCGRCHAPAVPELVAAWGSRWDRTAGPFERGPS